MESAFGKICIFAAHPGNPARRSLPSGASPSSPNSGFYFSFYVRPERNENLVLIALAHMLGAHFFSVSLFVEQSYCFSRTRRYFYTQLVSRGKVERLFYLNLYSSLSTISHSHLLRKMELTVNDKSILELVSSFLALRIFDENGGDWSSSVGVGIPPAGLITDVLVNFLLDDFDREFIRSFPGGSYARFLYKSFLSFPPFRRRRD